MLSTTSSLKTSTVKNSSTLQRLAGYIVHMDVHIIIGQQKKTVYIFPTFIQLALLYILGCMLSFRKKQRHQGSTETKRRGIHRLYENVCICLISSVFLPLLPLPLRLQSENEESTKEVKRQNSACDYMYQLCNSHLSYCIQQLNRLPARFVYTCSYNQCPWYITD